MNANRASVPYLCAPKSARAVALALTLGATLSGCDDPLKEPSLVSELRVLGAAVQVDGYPGRASVRRLDTATVTWLAVAPDLDASFGFGFEACVPENSGTLPLVCAAEPFARVVSNEASAAPPSFTFRVPGDVTSGQRLLVSGVICDAANPKTTAGAWVCPGHGVEVSAEVYTETAEFRNDNPDLTAADIDWLGKPWPAQSTATDCTSDAAAELPRIPAREGVMTIRIQPRAADRELLGTGSRDRESFKLANFATAGVFDRPAATLAGKQPDSAALELSWHVPASVERPELVRFWFVARDGRGGMSAVERRACLTPSR